MIVETQCEVCSVGHMVVGQRGDSREALRIMLARKASAHLRVAHGVEVEPHEIRDIAILQVR